MFESYVRCLLERRSGGKGQNTGQSCSHTSNDSFRIGALLRVSIMKCACLDDKSLHTFMELGVVRANPPVVPHILCLNGLG